MVSAPVARTDSTGGDPTDCGDCWRSIHFALKGAVTPGNCPNGVFGRDSSTALILVTPIDMTREVVVIPVSDLQRAKQFYT